MIKIGVDANGGDLGVEATVPGAMRAVSMFKDIEIVLYGDENKIKPLLTNNEISESIYNSYINKISTNNNHKPIDTTTSSNTNLDKELPLIVIDNQFCDDFKSG